MTDHSPPPTPITIRDLTDLSDCRRIVALEQAIWGTDAEIVPATVLFVSARRGGILVGADDGAALVGFVWSLPGWRDGRPTHWSHMLGVAPDARGRGLGVTLKRAQRDRALGQGCDLIEWTFDPLQAPNAHLNLAVLGCEARTYLENVYGEMSGPLHRGTPTDRLVAEWWIRRPSVESRLDRQGSRQGTPGPPADAPVVIETRRAGDWVAPDRLALDLQASEVCVPVPPAFGTMQQHATDLALVWRTATREAFQAYFARGYRATGFVLDRERGGGSYCLTRTVPGRGRVTDTERPERPRRQ